MAYSVILAHDKEYGIGYQGKLPWHYPEDLKYFQDTTGKGNKNLVCAYDTYKSLPECVKERVVVIMSTRSISIYGVKVLGNINHNSLQHISEDSDLFVIGGRSLFTEEILLNADSVHVTRINKTYKTDAKIHTLDQVESCLYQVQLESPDLTITKYYPRIHRGI